MAHLQEYSSQRGGFVFDNHVRNTLLAGRGYDAHFSSMDVGTEGCNSRMKVLKTGTTICGVVCMDTVVLGADTRATMGPLVCDKNCSKLHRISDNIWCAGAGTCADLDHVTELMASKAELHRLNTHTQPRVSMIVSILSKDLFKYQGYKGCAIVLGGVDIEGPALYNIYPHGSTDRSPYAAMGSGSLNAMAVLETGYKDGMSVAEGEKLVKDAIHAGIFNDLGSGGNVDICVVSKEGTKYHRGYSLPNPRLYRMPKPVSFPVGTTEFLEEKIQHIKSRLIVEETTQSVRSNA